MRKYLLLTILVTTSLLAWSQDFSNKGKDFWLGYGNHVRMFTGTPVEKMQIYITSDVNTTGNITIASIGFNQNFNVVANQITTIDIPRTAALMNEGYYNHGIHVTAQKDIVVYSFIYVNSVSGATLCLPTSTLGREYYSVNYTQVSNEPNASYSYFFVVATDTGTTTVSIKPTANTVGGRPANTAFQIPLTQGQVYQVLSATDLSGSEIKSVNTGTGCKKIAVFCGAGKMSIGCAGAGSSDNLYQQMYPTSTWGKTYVTAPSVNAVNTTGQYNYFRIFKSDPAAIVKYNGGLVPAGAFVNGQYATLAATNEPGYIESDMPIMVAQYFTTQGCAGNAGVGDPEMIYLNPVEQTVKNVTLNSMQPVTGTNINEHYINVYIKNSPAALNSFKIDGVGYAASFAAHPSAPGYAYARIRVNQGAHTVTCDTPYNAIAYGFGQTESYGYSAGTNLKDLYQFVSIQNDYATVTFPAGCKSTPFKFSMTFPYQPTSLTWKFNGLFPDTTIATPVYDSTWVVNGRTLYRYPLAKSYQINTTGTFPITVQAFNPTVDGCTGVQEIDYDLQIFDPPIANFTYNHNGCVSDSVAFFDGSNPLGRPIIKQYWDFGDGNTSNLTNLKHKYLTAGNKTVRHSVITDVGCLSDTASKVIPITDPPVAGFTTQAPYCEKSAITFKDASTITVGTINKWIWNFGDGGTLTALNGNDVQHTYTTAGTYNVTLQVETASGCLSTVFSKPVVINPLPATNFNLPGNICLPWDNAAFTDISTISDGTQASFVYAWDFGDGSAIDANKNPIHHYTAVGPYNVKLTVTTVNGCVKDTIKVLNTVYAQPRAGYTVSAEVCLNDTTRFTQSATGSGSTITNWNWTFGDGNTSTDQNPVHKYLTDGTFQTSLYIVTDKGCHSDTLTVPTIVNPLPVAAFTSSAPACETGEISFTDKSTVKQGSVVKWNWTLGDGTTSASQNPTNTYVAAGTYDITLGVESAKGCKSPVLTQPLKINYLPQTAFGTPEVCLSDPFAEFTDSSRIGDNTEAQFTYQWNFGDPNANAGNPNTSAQKNPRHKYTATGIYNVSLTVTSAAGCVTSVTKPFTVNGSIPQAAFTVNNANAICSNQEMSITDASTVNFGSVVKVEVYWDYGNNPTIKTVDETPNPGKQYIHQYPDFGTPGTKTFTIRYVAYSGINCINEITKTVTVKASPKVQFDAMANVCEEVPPFTLTAARDIYNFAGTGTYSGPGILNASGSFSPASAKPGTHTIRYDFNATNGCSAFAEQTITVDPTPAADAGPDRTVLEGGFIVINGKGTGNNVGYLWTPNTAIADNKVANPKVSPVEDITYTLTVTSAAGCVASDKVFVKVLKMPKVPNVFSPNGDGINDKWVIEYLDTYPGATVEVFNRYGQKVYESVGYDKPWDGTYRGQPLPVATYYWIINPKNGRQQMNGSVTIIR